MKIKWCILMILIAVIGLSSCQTTYSVQRVDKSAELDITGEWSATDVEMVCNDIISSCTNAAFFTSYKNTKRRNPIIKIGRFRNQSSEHIDASIITNKLRNAILDSGKADFVADNVSVEELRDERLMQSEWAGWETAKNIANEEAADFMIQGSIKSLVQKNGNLTVRTYYVNAEIVDIESGRIVWTVENDRISKIIKKPNYRW